MTRGKSRHAGGSAERVAEPEYAAFAAQRAGHDPVPPRRADRGPVAGFGEHRRPGQLVQRQEAGARSAPGSRPGEPVPADPPPASHRGVRSSTASYRHARVSPGTVSRAGPCSWSYQSWYSASATGPSPTSVYTNSSPAAMTNHGRACPVTHTEADRNEPRVSPRSSEVRPGVHFFCAGQSAGAAIGLIPDRSSFLTRIASTVMTSPRSAIPAETTYPLEKPTEYAWSVITLVAAACWAADRCPATCLVAAATWE